jgi:multimeric flavodoxin WrbA
LSEPPGVAGVRRLSSALAPANAPFKGDEIVMPLNVLALNCTLRASPSPSSTEKLLNELLMALQQYDAEGEIVRVVDHDIKPGVSSDEGVGDDWPGLRKRVLAADILIIGSPIWLGQPSSVAKRVLERMDAFLGERDEMQRMPSHGKVGFAAVVGARTSECAL